MRVTGTHRLRSKHWEANIRIDKDRVTYAPTICGWLRGMKETEALAQCRQLRIEVIPITDENRMPLQRELIRKVVGAYTEV